MKNRIARLTQSAIAIAAICTSSYGFAYDGTVNFKGSVVDAPCSISVETKDQLVEFGAVASTGFTGVGSTVTTKKFPIVLENCAVGTYTKTSIRFDATPDGEHIKLTPDIGVAKGVAVQLLYPDGSPVLLGYDSLSTNLNNGSNTLQFGARYIQTAAAVTTGPANAQAQFTVSYQ